MATADLVGGRIVLSGPPDLSPFISTLPENRWNAPKRSWTVAATPLAAAKIMESRRFAASADVHQLALSWDRAITPPTVGSLVGRRFGTDLWKHQQQMFAFAIEKYAAMFSCGMGTGKSATTVALLENWPIATATILCPRSVIGVWRREFERHADGLVKVLCLDKGTAAKKSAAVEDFVAGQRDFLRVVVVNYESAWRPGLAERLLLTDFDAVVLDESHRIKSHSGNASKFAYKLGKAARRRLCLTGTPMPHSPLDLYAQYRFLEPAIFGTSFTAFRSKYAVTDPNYHNRVLRFQNQEELTAEAEPLMIRIKSSDVLDLPPIVEQVIDIELEPKARKAYEQLKSEMIVELEAGTITAGNALTKLLRLQQITSGWVKTEDERMIEVSDAKRQVLEEMIDDMGPDEPVVVFCRFSSDIEAVRKVAKNLGRVFGEISGSHKDLTPHSTMPEGIQVMAVQQQSGGTGIDLTAARYVVWFSQSFSLGDNDQANARVHRPGQTKPVTIYRLSVVDSVDQLIARAIEQRRSVVDYVLDSIRPKVAESI